MKFYDIHYAMVGEAMKRTYFFIFLLSFILNLYAQWKLNGVAVCDTTDLQLIASNGILSDGEGGAIVIWGDNRDYWDIYAQRIDSSGRMLWENNGKAIVKAPGWQSVPLIVEDGSGGLVMIWNDTRNNKLSDIYAQRLSKDGNSLWENNGFPIIIEEHDQLPSSLIRTSDSCYIVCWQENKFYPHAKIYTQKLDKDGKLLWDSLGVEVAPVAAYPELVPDMQGGAILVWASSDDSQRLYAQRIDNNGNKLWGDDYVIAATNYCNWTNSELSVCSDGHGGAIIAWDYWEAEDYGDSYIQRVDSSGNRLWGNAGVQLGQNGKQQIDPRISLLPNGNIVVIYEEYPNIYLNKLNSNGILYWPSPGIKINDYNSYIDNQIAVCNNNIFIPIFNLTTLQPNRYTPHAHKIDTSGVLFWDYQGVNLSQFEIATNIRMHSGIIPDGKGGAIIAWEDNRNDYPYRDIYIQRVYEDGSVGGDTSTSINERMNIKPNLFDLKVYPNPFNKKVSLVFNLFRDRFVEVKIFDIHGRLIKEIISDHLGAGKQRIHWDGTNNTGKEVSSGVYFISVKRKNVIKARKVLFVK